jgi:predicted ATPase
MRHQSHRRVAQVLEARYPETYETQPERLAHHYTEPGLIVQAIPYWQRAGQRALERSASVAAIGHLTKGLVLLKILPDTSDHLQQDLALQTALGRALMVTDGHTAPEAERVYIRVRDLCEQVGDTASVKPLRSYLQHPEHPLPHYRLPGKILVDIDRFRGWLERFKALSRPTNIDQLVN